MKKNDGIEYKDFFSELANLSQDELEKQIDEISIQKTSDMVNYGKYEFEIDGLKYVVYLMLGQTFSGESFGEVSFEIKNHPNANSDEEREKMKYQLIGKGGNAISVLCKVFGSIWGYIDKNPLDYIYFSGKGGDRQRLYSLFSDKHVKKYLPEYEKIDYDPNTNEPTSETEYWFKRKK